VVEVTVYTVRVDTSRILCCAWFSAGAFIGCRLRVPGSRADQHAGKRLEHRFTSGRPPHLCILLHRPPVAFRACRLLFCIPLLHVMPWMYDPRGPTSLLSLLFVFLLTPPVSFPLLCSPLTRCSRMISCVTGFTVRAWMLRPPRCFSLEGTPAGQEASGLDGLTALFARASSVGAAGGRVHALGV